MGTTVLTLVDTVLPPLQDLLQRQGDDNLLSRNPPSLLWGKTLVALYTALIDLASPTTSAKISACLNEPSSPDIKGMLAALHLEPVLFPFLLERLSRTPHLIVDAPDEITELAGEILLQGALSIDTSLSERGES